MLFRIEAEAPDPGLGRLRAHRLQDPDRHHVLGTGQRRAHRHRAVVLAVVVFGLPRLAAGHASAEEERRVVDDRRRCETLFQGR